MCYFRNRHRVVGKRWPPAALTWSSMPVPCPRRQTSSSSSSRCPRKWFQQRCSSPCPASSCERAKPRKSSLLHHPHLQNQLTTPTLKECRHFKLHSHSFSLHCLCVSAFFLLPQWHRKWQYLTFPTFLFLDLSPSHSPYQPFLSLFPSMISTHLYMHACEVVLSGSRECSGQGGT